MRNTFKPTSMPVSRRVRGKRWVGTSAQENDTYHPSASFEIVAVLGVPSSGRCSRRGVRPILERLRIDTPIQDGPIPILRIGEAVVAVLALETGIARCFAGLHPTEET